MDPNGKEVIVTRIPNGGKDGRDLVIVSIDAKWVDKSSRLTSLEAQRATVSQITDIGSKKYERQTRKLAEMEKNYNQYVKTQIDELKQDIESIFCGMDANTEWKTEVNISDGTKGNIKTSDHVFYAVNNIEGAYARAGDIGGMTFYYNPQVYGDYTPQKTRAHETGHLLGLLHNNENLFNGKDAKEFGYWYICVHRYTSLKTNNLFH